MARRHTLDSIIIRQRIVQQKSIFRDTKLKLGGIGHDVDAAEEAPPLGDCDKGSPWRRPLDP
jgi:hypothetical protein